MSDYIKLIEMIIPVIAAIGGAFIGGSLTRKIQKETLNQQLKSEKDKERRKLTQETFHVYNRVLKVDGEYMIIESNGGHKYEIDLGTYIDKIRPILYERYHLLHSNVAKSVRKMDFIIQMCNHYEEVRDKDQDVLISNYDMMINDIRRHISEYRPDKEEV